MHRNNESETVFKKSEKVFLLLIQMKEDHTLILFDGECNLCHSWVKFILPKDKRGYFRFAALQSQKGKEIIHQFHIDTNKDDSVILVEKDKIYMRTTAGIRICKRLGFPSNLLLIFYLIPTFIRDRMYDFIAHNRYKWFGKKESCLMMQPGWKDRFYT